MGRRRRKRPTSFWPLGLVAAMAIVGLWVGVEMSGTFTSEGPARTLERAEEVGEVNLPPAPWDRVRVEVLNAGGVAGAATEAKDLLRDAGFDVVYFGNASSFGLAVSEVLDRTGTAGAAEALAQHIRVSEVRSEPDPTRLVDITVLVGADWNEMVRGERSRLGEPGAEDGSGALDPSWWDPRRFFERIDRVR